MVEQKDAGAEKTSKNLKATPQRKRKEKEIEYSVSIRKNDGLKKNRAESSRVQKMDRR